MLVDLDNTTIT